MVWGNIIWLLAYLGLFGYGLYEYYNYRAECGYVEDGDALVCAFITTEFAMFIFTALDACVLA